MQLVTQHGNEISVSYTV